LKKLKKADIEHIVLKFQVPMDKVNPLLKPRPT